MHPRIAGDFRVVPETLLPALACGNNAVADLRRSLADAVAGNFPEFHRWHLDVQINPVQ